MTDSMRNLPNRIVLLAFDTAQLLDISGPASVFGAATDEVPGAYEVVVVSAAGGIVTTNCGVGVVTAPIADIAPETVAMLIVVGGDDSGLRATWRDAAVRDWAVRVVALAPRSGSVCTGSLILAGWGLLKGRRVATHWRAVEALRARHPDLTVDGQALYVEDGRFWTSAGITTGIDMALAIVERDHGAAVATSVARRLVLYARRPGHQSQFSTLLDAQEAADGGYGALVEWIAANLDADLGIEALAARAGQSVRSFHRKFTAAVGRTPAAFVEALRLERARTLLTDGASLKRVAAEAGFGSAERLTRAFTRVFGVAPSTWRAVHAGAPQSHTG